MTLTRFGEMEDFRLFRPLWDAHNEAEMIKKYIAELTPPPDLLAECTRLQSASANCTEAITLRHLPFFERHFPSQS